MARSGDFAAPADKYTGKLKVDRDGGVDQKGPVPLPQWKAPLKRSEAKQDLQPGKKKGARQ